jgi:hypothetical protein
MIQSALFSYRGVLLKISDLKEGDLIFTVSNSNLGAGHIAICHKSHNKPKNVLIIHATNSPRYFSVCATKINPSGILSRLNNHYNVVRCTNQTLVDDAMFILRTWMNYQIPFDSSKLKEMEKYENTRPMRSLALKLFELKEKFNQNDYASQLKLFHTHKNLPPFPLENENTGFFCSQSIFLAFQIAAYPQVPSTLALANNLVSPTIMLHSLLKDETLFCDMGKLDFDYDSDDALFKLNLEKEREAAKETAIMRKALLFQYCWSMPASMKAMIAGKAHSEADMVRTALCLRVPTLNYKRPVFRNIRFMG